MRIHTRKDPVIKNETCISTNNSRSLQELYQVFDPEYFRHINAHKFIVVSMIDLYLLVLFEQVRCEKMGSATHLTFFASLSFLALKCD